MKSYDSWHGYRLCLWHSICVDGPRSLMLSHSFAPLRKNADNHGELKYFNNIRCYNLIIRIDIDISLKIY